MQRHAMVALALCAAALACAPAHSASRSVLQQLPEDPRAVIARGVGDGVADDTAALQRTIDGAANKGEGGIVFLPSGRYRITRTLLVPQAVRVYGVGATRPVFVLGASTPGFQRGVANMVVFTGGTPDETGKVPMPVPTVVPNGEQVRDANQSTFYSAMSNVDFEIGDGNPAAAAVRFRAAQHANLSHIDFHIGSGLAAIYQVGNIGYDLRFFGGRYGILTEKTSPAWQYTLLDSSFDGQREAAVREHEAHLTLVNVDIRNAPVGIEIERGYGDSLWGRDVHFENIAKAAVVISKEGSVFTQVGFEHATARKAPVFARFRDSGKVVAGLGAAYEVSAFNYGLTVPGLGSTGAFATKLAMVPLASAAPATAPALPPLPPSAQWINVHSLGVMGDGVTDDTAALQRAIDTQRVLYLPLGFYIVHDTLRMKADTVLVGLHPGLTQLVLPNNTAAFAGVGAPKALLESAQGGAGMVSGIGLATGEINPRALALLWKAGADSFVDDVRIQGGHGTRLASGVRSDPYAKTADFDPSTHWDRQYPSIWVTDGGGGTFAAIWTPSTFAQAGFYVSNTKTPGHVYELSAEHHVRAEIVLDGVENWEFLAPQTEEEVRDGMDALSMEIRNSRHLLIANYHAYRVTRSIKPAAAAVKISNSGDIRFRNVHVNAESGFASCDENGCATYLRASKYPFENAIVDLTGQRALREREFAVLDIPAGKPAAAAPALGKVVKLEDGFYSIAGAAVDAAGKLYFVDRHFQRIYGWSQGEGLSVLRDAPLDPVNLAVDKSGALMVLSSAGPEGTVYSVRPELPAGAMTVIAPTPVAAHAGARTALPVNFWQNGEFRDQLDVDTFTFPTLAQMFARAVALPKAREYVSPDGSLVLPAFRVLRQGPPNQLGYRWSDTLDTHGFVSAAAGERVVFTNGSQNLTFSALVGAGGALTDLRQVADRGGESAAVDHAGKVYVANGQVFIYAGGKQVGRIDVPERPLQLIFGGKDKRTLFILTHHALYASTIH